MLILRICCTNATWRFHRVVTEQLGMFPAIQYLIWASCEKDWLEDPHRVLQLWGQFNVSLSKKWNGILVKLTGFSVLRHNNKYRGYLSGQVVFCLAIDTSLLKSQREMWISGFETTDSKTADFRFRNCRFWISKFTKSAKMAKSASKFAKSVDLTDSAIIRFRPLIK